MPEGVSGGSTLGNPRSERDSWQGLPWQEMATFNKGMQSVLGGGTRTFKYPAILLLPNSPLPVLPFGKIKFQTKRNPLITVM